MAIEIKNIVDVNVEKKEMDGEWVGKLCEGNS